jgi:PAS domain S-box-containing protein
MADKEQMRTRQRLLGKFGEFALRSDDLDEILAEACRLVGEAMETGRAKVLEIEEERQTLFVRAGVGWDEDIVGQVRLPMVENSSETYSIRAGEPVVTNDLSREDRFDIPEFMKKAGVVALVNVPIRTPGGEAFGVLEVDATEPRDFGEDETDFLRTYTTILGPVIDRLGKVARLKSSEERLRLIVESARDYAIYLTDAQNRICDWFPGAEAVFGWTAEEAVGQSGSILFTREDREHGEDQKELETARTKGVAPDVRWHVRKDGSQVFIDGSVTALYGMDSALKGHLKIGQDVTDRRRSEELLRRSEALFRSFTEAAPSGVWIRDAATLRFEYVSSAFNRVFGMGEEQAVDARDLASWLNVIAPTDREAAARSIERARSGEAQTIEYRVTPAGGERWVRDIIFPIRDASDEVVGIGGISTDVTEEKQTTERLEILVAELQHRTRNLLGIVSAVARQTADRNGTISEFMDCFGARLNALARVNALLSRLRDGGRVSFDELLRTELSAHGALDGHGAHMI